MQQNKNIEYIIGIDFGHGETSAAICPMQWDTPMDMLDAVTDLEMGNNKKVIPSAIAICENGDAYIGFRAFNSDIMKKAEVNVCFKQAPKNIDGEKEQLMIRYMREVYKSIRENNPALLKDGNHQVYIATPSGWDSATMNLYQKMAEQAGLPIAGVTKESRAAFVRAQMDVTSGLGRNIKKGAIVFDMGSSTLDFTYLNLEQGDQMIDFGYDCGASFIEKTIHGKAKEKNGIIRDFEEKYPKLTAILLFEARTLKEEVYNDPESKARKSVYFDNIVDGDDDFDDERYKMVFEPQELNKLLGEVDYLKQIEDAMTDFKNNHIGAAPIYGVFLTGGASRMDFIKPMITKVWGIPDNKIYRDQNPSLTISQGVAEVARIDLRTAGLDEGLGPQIEKLIKNNVIYTQFAEIFENKLYESITDEVASYIVGFRDSDDNYSLAQLQDAISGGVKEGSQSVIAETQNIFMQVIDEKTAEIRKTVESMVKAYSNQGTNIKLPSISVSQNINVSNKNMNKVIKEISNNIAAESTDWSGAIGGAAIGAGIALFFGGPLAWLIGGAALVGKWLFGDNKTEEQKRQEAMKKVLDKDSRGKVFDSINQKWDEITNSIKQSIHSSISDNQQMKQAITESANNLLIEYKKNLKEARILVE